VDHSYESPAASGSRGGTRQGGRRVHEEHEQMYALYIEYIEYIEYTTSRHWSTS